MDNKLSNRKLAFMLILLSSRLLPSWSSGRSYGTERIVIVILGLCLTAFAYGIYRVDDGSPVSSIISVSVMPFPAVSFLSFLILINFGRKQNSTAVSPRLSAVRQIRITCPFAILPFLLAISSLLLTIRENELLTMINS